MMRCGQRMHICSQQNQLMIPVISLVFSFGSSINLISIIFSSDSDKAQKSYRLLCSLSFTIYKAKTFMTAKHTAVAAVKCLFNYDSLLIPSTFLSDPDSTIIGKITSFCYNVALSFSFYSCDYQMSHSVLKNNLLSILTHPSTCVIIH